MSGLHHVTAIAGDPIRNFGFYTRDLGLPAGHFKFLRVWSVKFLHPRGRTRDC
ncbi:catechol 2,3-dioxygenase-like lactoylglutathione lyase family enzyme [Bradyrhizobium japonicum]